MKKILALVLALVMVLAATAALAAGSPDSGKWSGATTPVEEVKAVKISATEALQAIIDGVTEAAQAGDAVSGLPEGGKALVPAELKTINEMDCYQLSGDPSKLDELKLVFYFTTDYSGAEAVTLLIGISPADAEVEWLALEGKPLADGGIEVTVTAEELKKISNNPFIVIPVSK